MILSPHTHMYRYYYIITYIFYTIIGLVGRVRMAAAAVTATTTGHIIQPFLAKNLARESIFERIHSVNEKINAFVKLVKPEEFVNSRNDDEGGRLNGVTVGVKDNIHLSGYASSCASAMLKGIMII